MKDRALILFDGTCHLCNGVVQFLARRDRAGRFQFAPRDGETPTTRIELRSIKVEKK